MKTMQSKNSMKMLLHQHDDYCGCGHNHHDHHHEGVHCDGGHGHHHEETHHHEHHEESCHCGCGHDHHDHEHDHCHNEDDSGGEGDGDDHHQEAHLHEHHEESCHCGCGHDHHDHNHDHHDHEHTHNHEHDHNHDHDHEHCHCNDHEHNHEHDHDHPRHVDAAVLAKADKKVYTLENLGCAHCAAKMEEKINQLPTVKDATITFATKQLRIAADDCDALLPEIRKICSSIESQVKVVNPAEKAKQKAAAETAAEPDSKQKKKTIAKDKLELGAIIVGALLFAGGAILHHAGANIDPRIVIALSVVSYLILGGKVILEALRNISKGQIFDENFLMSVATIGAFAISEYLEAVGVMLFYRIGEYFEHKAVEKSRGQIMDAIDMRPEVVSLVKGSSVTVIPAEEAAVGDILLIRPGDRIPLDGIITEGESRIDTSPITGEPVPVSANPGDTVTSGCVNTSGQLLIRVEKVLSESMVSKILDSVENAAAGKPKIDRFITRFSRVYTPCVVIAALLLAVIPSLVTGNWNYWVYTALTFLVMSCPCALVLSVPLAFFSGIGAGSRKGILFKGGLSMEALGKLKAVVMDKTGTITEGNFMLQKVIAEKPMTEDALLALCAGCEQNSTHPIAVSIVNAARERGLSIAAPENLTEIAGCGIAAETEKGLVLCGNHKLMDKYHVTMPTLSEVGNGAEVFVAVDGQFSGCLIIADTIKSDAKLAVSRLKEMGLYTVMLTGDSKESAEEVAAQVGIDRVYAKLLPQDKLTMLSKVREEQGRLMFVGDGINDAPVLAGADVGAAMGSGADAAIEAADAVFMQTGLTSIPDAISISKATGRIAKQNVIFALLIKAIVMVLGVCGFANMWLAVFADSGVAMLCVLNSIRALYKH